MKENFVLPPFFGVGAALLAWSVLTGRQPAFISGYIPALILLMILGMGMCATGGIGVVAKQGTWAQPLPIVSYVLGTLILFIAAAVLIGWQLPLISGARQAFIAVAALAAAKVLVTFLDKLV